MCGTYVLRNSRRWPLTIFFDLMNVGGINALILYQLKHPKKKIIRRDFVEVMKPLNSKLRQIDSIPKEVKEISRILLDIPVLTSSNQSSSVADEMKCKRINERWDICPRESDICIYYNNCVCKEHQKDMSVACINCDRN